MKIKDLIFEDLNEEATTVEEAANQNLALYILKTTYGIKAVLYSPVNAAKVFEKYPVFTEYETRRTAIQKEKDVVFGVVTANFEKKIGGYEIDTVGAVNSYGPMMYDILSSLGGWIIRDTVGITDAALRVWKYIFTKRTDWEYEWAPEEFRVNNRKANPLNYKYKIRTPISVQSLVSNHEQFVKSISKDRKEVEVVLSAFGSLFFEKVYRP